MELPGTFRLDELPELSKKFSRNQLIRAQKVLQNSKVSISFQKGSLNDSFIVSGIMYDGEDLRVKIKAKYQDSKQVFTSKCNCLEWSEEDHCIHSAALLLKFSKNEQLKNQASIQGKELDLKAQVLSTGAAVHVEEYGRIITDPRKLIGSYPNSTYSSLQYLLTNKKIVNFPLSEKFNGKIQINLIPTSKIEEFKSLPHLENKFFPIFSYINNENENKKISLFENLYIFDWNTGESFHQPKFLQELSSKLKNIGLLHELNSFYKIIEPLENNQDVDIFIDGTALKDFSYNKSNLELHIQNAERKSYLDLNIFLRDKDNKSIALPSIFKIMVQENGLLSSFRTKTSSFKFLEYLTQSLRFNHQEYKKHIYSSSKRSFITDEIDDLLTKDEFSIISLETKSIYTLQTKFVLDFLVCFFDSFGFNATKSSFLKEDGHRMLVNIPKNQLLGGVSLFYNFLKIHSIPLYYNKSEVKTWSSNIRFEREKKGVNWFGLDLIINEKDLDIVKRAKINDNYLISDDELVIFEKDEKKLLNVMKKYTLHEGEKQEISESGVKRFSLNFKKARIFELFELKKFGIEGALTQEEEDLCKNLMNLKEMPEYDLPANFKKIARNYQVTGYNWLRFLHHNKFGACLADDMGLGKTLQTIMFIDSIIDQVERILIVCPVSLLVNWQNEFKKFSQDIDVQVYYGKDRAKNLEKKIILTSYGIMKKESFSTFEDISFDILVMDEVQQLKNIRSQGAIAARNIKSHFRVCLTGTPVENDLSEFYNIMDLSVPGIWGELSFLKTKSTKKNRLLAKNTVKPFILRRTKDQVLTELPEKVENLIYLDFCEAERDKYLETLGSVRKRMQEVQSGRKYSEILKSLLQLRQLCLWQNNQSFMSTKVNYLMENLSQLIEQGHKILVFSQFTTYLNLIQDKIREQSWDFARIDGSQTMKKRASEVERFQEGDAKIFLISLKAGGVGLNLTAASYIFLMDPWWNPAVENQAIDRAYRIGQKNKLTVYRPIIKNSVEEKVLILQNAKRELFKELMSNDDEMTYNGKLSMDDFQSLLT